MIWSILQRLREHSRRPRAVLVRSECDACGRYGLAPTGEQPAGWASRAERCGGKVVVRRLCGPCADAYTSGLLRFTDATECH